MGLTDKQVAKLLRYLILALIMVLAVAERLYSILRFESIIHEFDPYFNYRSTRYLVNEGIYDFLNWFDEQAWYPLGRIVGGTVYPGIMFTAAFVYWTLHALNITIKIRNICVLLAPFFSSLTALSAYLFTSEIRNPSAGLYAAAFLAVAPGYISRSVAGSFDNEGVAIFALIFTYWLWLRAVKSGSMLWAAFTALSYFYMVAAWGGYVFIINLVPLHVLALLVSGRYTARVYVAYSTFYVVGTILSMQVHFVGFQAVQSSETMGAMGVFGLLQLFGGLQWARGFVSEAHFARFVQLTLGAVAAGIGLLALLALATGYVAPWTGRFYSLMDPTYASKNIPIIASVSEHQPTTWGSYVFDLHVLIMLAPVGLYQMFHEPSEASIFAIVYSLTSIYFSGVMVRLMLVLTPIVCVLAAVGVSSLLDEWLPLIKQRYVFSANAAVSAGAAQTAKHASNDEKKRRHDFASWPDASRAAWGVVALLTTLTLFFQYHSTWVTSEAYSSPSIVLASKNWDGSRNILDDFRESYRWINQNTDPDARIMSWWDYGYQLAAMSNRTVLVDNNTWNNTHIAQVGKAFASNEEDAYEIMQRLDVDYVLVWFGGASGYSSDDINKFLWMVRIANSVDPGIQEHNYIGKNGQYSIGPDANPVMLDSLMYKLSFYRFGEYYAGQTPGYDRVRNTEIGRKDFKLTHVEEAYTSEHWLVRIYKVLKHARQ